MSTSRRWPPLVDLLSETPTTQREVRNPFISAQGQLRETIERLGLRQDVWEILREPMRMVELSIPVPMDNGTIKNFTGYRCQHTDVLGPMKGGIRFHPKITPDDLKALALWMTLKTAIVGLPLGGAKGGIQVDPQSLSEREMEYLSRMYIRQLAPLIGPTRDIPAPDVNTDARVMGWMLDEFSSIRGESMPGMITGKPIILGGSMGRVSATGHGVVMTIEEAFRRLGITPSRATAAIQGFGNVGQSAAHHLQRLGVRVVALNDLEGGAYLPGGFPVDQAMRHHGRHGSIRGFPGSEPISSEQLLQLAVDVVVPAAVENQITEAVARSIRAKIVAEAANGPTTPDGDRVLSQRNVFVIPDILCNAGGVTVSYFEWVQNTSNYYWPEEEVDRQLGLRMSKAFGEVYAMQRQRGVDMRTAAYMVAVERLAEAMKARGWFVSARAGETGNGKR